MARGSSELKVMKVPRDFQWLRLHASIAGSQFQFPVREPRSGMPSGTAKKREKEKNLNLVWPETRLSGLN